MKRVPVADVCLVNPRLSPSLAVQSDRDVDFVPMANLGQDGRITLTGSRKLSEVLRGYTYFENGDVIVAKITPCLENGKAAYVRDLPNGIGFGSTEFHVLRPQKEVDARFLFYMLWSSQFRHEASQNMTGTAGQQRVPAGFFERFQIPLPGLNQQRRIADILDKADMIRRKRRSSIEIDELIKSIFFHMFGDPLTARPASERVTFGDLTNRITYGFTCPMEHIDQGIPIITGKNIRDGFIDFCDVHYARKDQFDSLTAKSKPNPGDILIIKDGAIRGRCAILDATFPICINQSVALGEGFASSPV